jgi:hypothetical protein
VGLGSAAADGGHPSCCFWVERCLPSPQHTDPPPPPRSPIPHPPPPRPQARSSDTASTARVWMKSAIVERELGDAGEERRLLEEGLRKFPGVGGAGVGPEGGGGSLKGAVAGGCASSPGWVGRGGWRGVWAGGGGL